MDKGDILVDLDGTLAEYHDYGPGVIGKPIPIMLERIRGWMEEGYRVKLFTARASVPEHIPTIRAWLDNLGLNEVEITNSKDYRTVLIVDDRAIGVIENTGLFVTDVKDKRRVK